MAIRKIISRSIGVDVIAAEDLAAGSVETAEIQNGAVTGPKLADNLNYDSGTLYLDSTNNRVGIGTTSPGQLLQIESTSTAKVRLAYDATRFGEIGRKSNGSYEIASFEDGADIVFGTTQGAGSGTSTNERMRIDSTGKVGIGTTTSPYELTVANSSDVNISIENKSSVTSGNRGTFSCFNSAGSTVGVVRFGADTDNVGTNIQFWGRPVGGSITEHMRIDSSGNVGIGAIPETTFAQKRTLRLSTTASLIAGNAYYPYPYYVANNLYYDSSDNLKYIASSGGALLDVNAHLGGRFTFYTAPAGTAGATASITERVRIHTSGATSFGTSDASPYTGTEGFVVALNDGHRYGAIFGCDNIANREAVIFVNPNGQVGSIRTNGSSTSYNTSSDYRLKDNVTSDWEATTRLKQLNPVRFNFIADADTTVDGFLAHEVQDIIPEAITGEKDGMRDEEYEVTPTVEATYDDDGNILTEEVPAVMATRSVPNYQGIDQAKLVPLLVKSLQEALTEIDSLKARLDDAGL